ncbi:hypothetical protein PspLS_09406 [Pyricularia sp. CBS 133598]|nr:hypothetical protein PspLS_09406 [Pyricularia sp. CBS 133598]
MVWHERESIGTLLPRSVRRKFRRHTTATTSQQDDDEDHVLPTLTPESQPPTGLLMSRISRALCPSLQRRSPKPISLPIDDVPRLRFDDCHHEVHISGGATAASSPSRPTSQLQSQPRQRRTSLLARARNSCLEKLDDARLARRCCCIRVAGRLGGRGCGRMSRLRASTTSCCSNTPWSSSTNVGVTEAVAGGGDGGWALEIYFAMEFEVQSEPRPDYIPQGQASSRLQGMSSVGCRAAP